MDILDRDYEVRAFTLTIPAGAGGSVVGKEGDTQAALEIDGTGGGRKILHWHIHAPISNGDALRVKRGRDAFVAAAGEVGPDYEILQAGESVTDAFLLAGLHNQNIRVASDGVGDVVVTGRVVCRLL